MFKNKKTVVPFEGGEASSPVSSPSSKPVEGLPLSPSSLEAEFSLDSPEAPPQAAAAAAGSSIADASQQRGVSPIAMSPLDTALLLSPALRLESIGDDSLGPSTSFTKNTSFSHCSELDPVDNEEVGDPGGGSGDESFDNSVTYEHDGNISDGEEEAGAGAEEVEAEGGGQQRDATRRATRRGSILTVAAGGKKKANDGIINLPEGDFEVMICIHSVRMTKLLDNGKKKNSAIDPVVFVEVLNQRFNARAMGLISGETATFQFEKTFGASLMGLSAESFEDCEIKVTVIDSNCTLTSDELIGTHLVDLSRIYVSGRDHVMSRKWVGLFNDRDENENLEGERTAGQGRAGQAQAQAGMGRIRRGGCGAVLLHLFNAWFVYRS